MNEPVVRLTAREEALLAEWIHLNLAARAGPP